MTEKLLLFGGAIQMAGTIKSRKSDRHAKSDWSGNVNDLQRGLNKRGYNSCRVISKELKKK